MCSNTQQIIPVFRKNQHAVTPIAAAPGERVIAVVLDLKGHIITRTNACFRVLDAYNLS